MQIPKNKRLKSTKITQSAKGETCELRTQFCNNNPQTTVFCHAPSDDLAYGMKNHDWWGAYGCSSCHDFVDGKPVPNARYSPSLNSKMWKEFNWTQPIYRTLKKLFQKGLIKT